MSIEEHCATIEQARAAIAGARDRQIASLGRARAAVQQARSTIDELLAANEGTIASAVAQLPAPLGASWEPAAWHRWDPIAENLQRDVRYAQMREDRTGEVLALPLSVPVVAGGGVVVRSRRASEAAGDALLRSLILRVACALPHDVRFLLLDPSGLGENYRNVKQLPGVMTADPDPRRALDGVIDHIRHVNRTYLDGAIRAFHELPEPQRRLEDFRIVVCADVPHGYDSRAVEALRTIAETGPRAGVYLLMHEVLGGEEVGLPFTPEMRVLDVDERKVSAFGIPGTVELDGEPPTRLATELLARLAAATPEDTPVSWRDLQPPREQWWSETTLDRIEVAVGMSGVSDEIHLVFGADRSGTPVVHGIFAATTGGGKSTFFHNLIAGIATRYPPEELELFLVDGKFGTEFARYADLPHASVVSLHTNPEVARSLLRELVDEMERRNTRFRRAGCADIREYRQQTGEVVPRILLIADEYHELFERDSLDEASASLVKLGRQGRSVGVHMLLASQGFQAKGMKHRDEMMQNVHLRIAMMMTDETVNQLSEFQAEGRRLIATTCDQIGKLVLNHRSGADGSNVAGRGALLLDEDDAQVRAAIADRFPGRSPIVLDGNRQPDARVLLPFSADLQPISSASELQHVARASLLEGGFGTPDWVAADRPLLLPCGRALDVRGQVAAVLARGPDANVLLVGDDTPVRLGMLATMCTAVAALAAHGAAAQLLVADLSREGTDWFGLLPRLLEELRGRGLDADLVASEAATSEAISAATLEVERRVALTDREVLDEPSLVVVLHDPDRVGDLVMVEDDFGPEPSKLGRVLLELLRNGPRVGVHVVVSIAAMGSFRALLPDRSVGSFRHRVGLQMSEDDAFSLMTEPTPARLAEREPPTLGAYMDSRRGSAERFVPPSLEMDLAEPNDALLASLAAALGASR